MSAARSIRLYKIAQANDLWRGSEVCSLGQSVGCRLLDAESSVSGVLVTVALQCDAVRTNLKRARAKTRSEGVFMMLIILIIVLIFVFGGGAGYYGYNRWGSGGGAGIGLGTILLILLVCYLLGLFN